MAHAKGVLLHVQCFLAGSEAYSPLVQLAYTAHASVLFLCSGFTKTMKGITLCAYNVGSYAFTNRNRKNKKNVPLETRPSKNVPPVPCMGTL